MKVDGSYNYLCDTCPMNCLEEEEAINGAGRVLGAELENRRIGRAKNELGIMINACRLARQNGDCSDTDAIRGGLVEEDS